MLKITVQTDSEGTLFELEGKLTGPWVDELRWCCEQFVSGRRPRKVLLKAVSFIDAAGKDRLSPVAARGPSPDRTNWKMN